MEELDVDEETKAYILQLFRKNESRLIQNGFDAEFLIKEAENELGNLERKLQLCNDYENKLDSISVEEENDSLSQPKSDLIDPARSLVKATAFNEKLGKRF